MVGPWRLVSLDFGGTLDGTGVAPRERRWAYYASAGIAFSRDELKAAHYATRERILTSGHAGEWPLSTAVRMWFTIEAELLGVTDHPVLQWAEQFLDEESHLLRAADEVLGELSERYPLVLVSNNIGNLHVVLQEVGLARHFAAVADSAVYGLRKPDPRIFTTCAAKAGVTGPHSCSHLGDSWATDVVGAMAANWTPVLLRPGRDAPTSESGVPCVRSLSEYGSWLDHGGANGAF